MYKIEKLWFEIKEQLTILGDFHNRSKFKRYAFPFLATLLVLFLKSFFYPLLGRASSFVLLSSIVAISSLYGGLGPGLLATFIAALTNYQFFLTIETSRRSITGDIILTIIFIIEGLLISSISEAKFEAEKEKDQFIGFAGHELKNPLSVIKGFSELTISKARKKKLYKILEYTQEINNQTDIMVSLINDLLDMTRIRVGSFTYKFEDCDIEDLVEGVVDYQRVVFINRKIKLLGSSNRTIYADRYRISQVISNLIINALKYSGDDKPIEVKIKNNKNSVLISVKDFGIGISPDDRLKIFTLFYRASQAKRNSKEGLGLGLYISTKIIQHHKGKIWVKSSLGKGSTFYVELNTI